MRWPWARNKDTSGRKARQVAEAHLQETRNQWPEVNRVAGSLRELRERNHFAEQLQHIFQGGETK